MNIAKSRVPLSEVINVTPSCPPCASDSPKATSTSYHDRICQRRTEMIQHVNTCKRTYKDEVLYGKRCLEVIDVYYEPKDKIYYRFPKEGRIPCHFIQNTKKGFYLKRGEVIVEFFYDSFEGWYIQSFYGGHKKAQLVTCESSARYRQCDCGLDLNTRSADDALSQL